MNNFEFKRYFVKHEQDIISEAIVDWVLHRS